MNDPPSEPVPQRCASIAIGCSLLILAGLALFTKDVAQEHLSLASALMCLYAAAAVMGVVLIFLASVASCGRTGSGAGKTAAVSEQTAATKTVDASRETKAPGIEPKPANESGTAIEGPSATSPAFGHPRPDWYAWPTDLDADSALVRLAIILTIALIGGYGFPAFLARGNAFTPEQVKTSWCTHLLDHDKLVAGCEQARQYQETHLGPEAYTCHAPRPVLRTDFELETAACHDRSSSAVCKRYFRGLDGNTQQFLYSSILAILGSLITFFSPQIVKKKLPVMDMRTAGLALVVFASMRWLRAYRLFWFAQPDRRIVSYVHHDVSFWGTLYNDLLFLAFVYLIVLIWTGSIHYAKWLSVAPAQVTPRALVEERFDRLVHVFSLWKATSFAIGLVFVYLAVIYWDILLVMKDRRYIASAVLVQLMWVATWITTSLPLAVAWGSWRQLTVRLAIGKLSLGNDREKTYERIVALRPIGVWELISISLASVVTFVLPIVQALLKAK